MKKQGIKKNKKGDIKKENIKKENNNENKFLIII